MSLNFTHRGQTYAVSDTAYDLSIPIRFDEPQLSVFGSPPATAEALCAGSFIGDVNRGGSCNCFTYHITPHCNGTHSEAVGHIADGTLNISDITLPLLIAARLITIRPTLAADANERYIPAPRTDDPLITKAALMQALAADDAFLDALIIRTLPNPDGKPVMAYNSATPPYFSLDAIEYINTLGVQHLLVDVPSIDRLDDDGHLSNHHCYWGIRKGDAAPALPSQKTVTELIYVASHINDGAYALNLQLAPLIADATPSRPIIYKVERS